MRVYLPQVQRCCRHFTLEIGRCQLFLYRLALTQAAQNLAIFKLLNVRVKHVACEHTVRCSLHLPVQLGGEGRHRHYLTNVFLVEAVNVWLVLLRRLIRHASAIDGVFLGTRQVHHGGALS